MKRCAVTAVKQDGLTVRVVTLLLETDDEKLDINTAIRNACKEYIRTPEGKNTLRRTSGCFNWADFIKNVPDTICCRHGFVKIDIDENYVTQWDEQLIGNDA